MILRINALTNEIKFMSKIMSVSIARLSWCTRKTIFSMDGKSSEPIFLELKSCMVLDNIYGERSNGSIANQLARHHDEVYNKPYRHPC